MLHTNEPYTITSWAELPRAIEVSEGAGAIGQAHLFRALMRGRIAFLPLLPDMSGGTFKRFTKPTSHRPAITLVGDDDGMDRGPAGWPIAERAVRWARSVLIHGAGAEIAHYETAIIAAGLVHRVLIIECGSATLDAWVDLIRAAPHRPTALVIKPRGGVHPVPPDRSRMQ